MGTRTALVSASLAIVCAGCFAPKPKPQPPPPPPYYYAYPPPQPYPYPPPQPYPYPPPQPYPYPSPPPPAVAPAPPPPPPERPTNRVALGLTLVALDACGWLLLGAADSEYLDSKIPLGDRHDNTGLAVLGGAMLLLDGTAVHCATGHCKEGASMSLTLRVGLPLLVLSIADKAGAGSDSAKDIALITFLIADLIDIGATFGIDFDEEQRKKDAAKAKLTVMPMRGGGAVVGIAGGF